MDILSTSSEIDGHKRGVNITLIFGRWTFNPAVLTRELDAAAATTPDASSPAGATAATTPVNVSSAAATLRSMQISALNEDTAPNVTLNSMAHTSPPPTAGEASFFQQEDTFLRNLVLPGIHQLCIYPPSFLFRYLEKIVYTG